MLEIIGSQFSPYTRMIRVTCKEFKFNHTFTETPSFFAINNKIDSELEKINPLRRVPILIDGENIVFESRQILEYLVQSEPDKSALTSIRIMNYLSVCYGVIDAGITQFVFSSMHPELQNETGYMERLTYRITKGLMWINNQNTASFQTIIPKIVLTCGLDWMKRRNILRWDRNLVNVQCLYDEVCTWQSFKQTAIPESESSGGNMYYFVK